MTQEEREELWPKWRKLVNMSASEIEAFMKTPEGKAAGLSREEASKKDIARGRDSARALLRMLPSGGQSYKQAEKNWSRNDWEWAQRQYGFISRMRGVEGPLYGDDGEMTRKLTSLLIWGHDPRKEENPALVEICEFPGMYVLVDDEEIEPGVVVTTEDHAADLEALASLKRKLLR